MPAPKRLTLQSIPSGTLFSFGELHERYLKTDETGNTSNRGPVGTTLVVRIKDGKLLCFDWHQKVIICPWTSAMIGA